MKIDFGIILRIIQCTFLIGLNCISIVLQSLMYPPLLVEVRKQHGVTVPDTLGIFKDVNKLFETSHHILQALKALKTSDL